MKKTMKDPIHVRARLVATRGFEILLDTGTGPKAHWLPKDSVIDNHDGTFTMEKWLAYERGIDA